MSTFLLIFGAFEIFTSQIPWQHDPTFLDKVSDAYLFSLGIALIAFALRIEIRNRSL